MVGPAKYGIVADVMYVTRKYGSYHENITILAGGFKHVLFSLYMYIYGM